MSAIASPEDFSHRSCATAMTCNTITMLHCYRGRMSVPVHIHRTENFDKAMIVHAVRKNVRKSWHNDHDQFLQPMEKPSVSFVRRCAVWNLLPLQPDRFLAKRRIQRTNVPNRQPILPIQGGHGEKMGGFRF